VLKVCGGGDRWWWWAIIDERTVGGEREREKTVVMEKEKGIWSYGDLGSVSWWGERMVVVSGYSNEGE
jgi:hypothetical protein